MTATIVAPVAGALLTLAAVPDPVFAGHVVGPGVALAPPCADTLAVLAPIAGVVDVVYPHAFVITSEQQISILVHLGINTVTLNGHGFDLRLSAGDHVTATQEIGTFSTRAIHQRGLCAVCPVIALELPATAICPAAARYVTAGAPVFAVNQSGSTTDPQQRSHRHGS